MANLFSKIGMLLAVLVVAFLVLKVLKSESPAQQSSTSQIPATSAEATTKMEQAQDQIMQKAEEEKKKIDQY